MFATWLIGGGSVFEEVLNTKNGLPKSLDPSPRPGQDHLDHPGATTTNTSIPISCLFVSQVNLGNRFMRRHKLPFLKRVDVYRI